jgi:PleD family two-component response regulator
MPRICESACLPVAFVVWSSGKQGDASVLGMKYRCRDGEGGDTVEILVVDDHAWFREALRGVLREAKGDATVSEASTCSQAMRVIAEHPDRELCLT